MGVIYLRKERTQLEDENSAKTNKIKEEASLYVMRFDYGGFCLQLTVFVKASI